MNEKEQGLEQKGTHHLRVTDDRWHKIRAIGRGIRSTSYTEIIDYALSFTVSKMYPQENTKK